MNARSGLNIDRLLAVAFVFMVTVALAGVVSQDTAATFTGSTTNPSNTVNTLLVNPPASQNATTSSAGGVVNLSWTATTTAPGAGHTLTYLVLRGAVGGPYAQIGTTNSSTLSYSDTPSSDGTYEYVIQAKITGGGSFTSANSAARTGLSDRTVPTAATGLTSAKGSTTGTINLSWTAGSDTGSGLAGYTIRRTNVTTTCPAQNAANYPNTITVGTVTSYTVTGLVSGSKYCFYLVANDNAGNASANSNTAGPTSAK